jgi:type I restriction enzyme S subunit
MAENLYKEWFAYKKIHNSAKQVKIKDIISITRGISYSSAEIDCEDGVDLINLKNIQGFGGFRLDGTKKYNGKYKSSQIVKTGDLVMGVTDMTQDRRTVGHVALIPHTSNVSVISADLIKLSSQIDSTYLYVMFRYGNVSRHISQFANGSNVLHLRPQVVENVKILLPEQELIDKFVSIIKPIFSQINTLQLQSANLTRQRDLLLPRLMSGQLTPLTNQ